MRGLLIGWSRLGDGVISTGVAGRLLDTRPGLELSVAAGALALPLFRAMPGRGRLIEIEKRPWHGHWWELWRDIAGTGWDLVVDLRGSALAYMVRAGERRVFARTAAPVSMYTQMGAFMGAGTALAPRAWCAAADRVEAARRFSTGAPILAVAPGANFPAKAWASERFAAVARRLTGPDGILAGARVAAIGGPGEEGLAEAVLAGVPAARRLALVGAQPLAMVGAALARCAFFVGNDSGLMHLAAASGCPTLGLFGPSDPRVYGPHGAHAATVGTDEPHATLIARIPDRHGPGALMASLPVDKVVAAAEALWRSQPGRSLPVPRHGAAGSSEASA
ncbi:MAG: glycosyltransferase family 9 protein [Alphaproteobacteria bacterium]|nr:glycosyltransferase family 9 protein [Alphaproteobacteria bacterium]